MQPKRRQKDRPRRSFFRPPPAAGAGAISRPGASALSVSDGDNFAPRREHFLCLRRPHFFQQRKKWGKERRQKLRFCTSSARYAQQRFPAYSRGQSPLLSLSVKRTACTFTGAEADAAACFSHGRRFSLLPPSPKAFPLDGSAVLNDRPVACQIRGPTDPQGDRCPRRGRMRCSRAAAQSPPSPPQRAISRPGASAFFVSDGPISSNSGRNGGKNAGRNYVSAHPQRAIPACCRPLFSSRARHFLIRCQFPDCSSTVFRCRCPLLR